VHAHGDFKTLSDTCVCARWSYDASDARADPATKSIRAAAIVLVNIADLLGLAIRPPA
jgi:hypothetical protein